MKKLIFSGLILALLAGCRNDSLQKPSGEDRIRVTTAKVLVAGEKPELSYSGTVEASQTIPLNFQIAGIVDEVYVDAGDEVKKGQVLAKINDDDQQNIYQTTLAKYNQAKDAYDRLKSVHDNGSLPDIKWVEMKTDLEQAKSSFDLARNNLEKCKLTAPVSGTIGKRNIEPGQASINLMAAPLELVRIEKVLVRIPVPENEINRIKKGMHASISVMAVDGTRFDGIVSNISPVAEPVSRTYTVKIALDNPGYILKPGMVCDVSLSPAGTVPYLVVPYQAVTKGTDGKNYVFLVNPGQSSVRRQPVIIGGYSDNRIEIITGLKEGETVVTGGIEKLFDNCLIEE